MRGEVQQPGTVAPVQKEGHGGGLRDRPADLGRPPLLADLFTIETWRESSRIGPGRPVKHMLKGADPVPVDGPANANSSWTRPARSRRRGWPNRLSG